MDNAKTCRFGFIHVIEQGDTLYKLGKRYGVTVSALLFANPWVNVYNLQIGMNCASLILDAEDAGE